MADLEDFFAKRDKKKSKGKKFDTADDVAKIMEEKAKERKKQESVKYKAPLNEDGTTSAPLSEYRAQAVGDDEWIDPNDDEPNLDGLQIQDVVVEEEIDIGDKDSDSKKDGDGESAWSRIVKKEEIKPTEVVEKEADTEEKPAVSNSTQKSEGEKDKPTAVAAPSEESKPTAEPSEPKPSKYIPPSKRGGQPSTASASVGMSMSMGTSANPPQSSGSYVPPSRRAAAGGSSSVYSRPKKMVGAPNINDEEYFPSLGS